MEIFFVEFKFTTEKNQKKRIDRTSARLAYEAQKPLRQIETLSYSLE